MRTSKTIFGSKSLFAMGVLLMPLFLASCSSKEPNLYSFFETFSQYKSDDDVLTFNVQFSNKKGKGKAKLNDKNLSFVWSRYQSFYSHGINVELENGGKIVLELSSIKKTDGTYSQDKILAKAIDPDGVGQNVDLIRWSSPIYKEKDLSDEEIDVKSFEYVGFKNDTWGLSFKYSEKEKAYLSDNYVLSFQEEKRFLITKKKYEEKVEGSYEVSRKFLYLDFINDGLFHLEGRVLPFTLEETL